MDATRQLTVTPPAAASACTVPIASYLVPGILVATRAVIESGAKASGRMFTEARKTALFAEMGVAYDPARAQVFVHVDGAPTRVVSLTATHDPAWARSAAWTAGDSGVDVFFPNVAVGAGSTDLAVVGGALGTGAIPLVANTITLVTVH
ncbi:MAG: hypothetical protein NT062_31485 [Proteobacteria bacterium]|nr:hypothetical protein [Pseudomonadota bacterium]